MGLGGAALYTPTLAGALLLLSSAFFSRFGSSLVDALDVARSRAGDEVVQVIAVGAVLAEVHVIEQPLYAAACADSIGMILIVPDRPAHTRMPAAAEQNRGGGA